MDRIPSMGSEVLFLQCISLTFLYLLMQFRSLVYLNHFPLAFFLNISILLIGSKGGDHFAISTFERCRSQQVQSPGRNHPTQGPALGPDPDLLLDLAHVLVHGLTQENGSTGERISSDDYIMISCS